MQETIAKIVRLAKQKRKPIAVEQLDFKTASDGQFEHVYKVISDAPVPDYTAWLE